MAKETTQETAPEVASQQPTGIPFEQFTIEAVNAHFTAEKARAVANLNNYIFKSAGIPEHPDSVAEVIKLIEAVSHADGCLNTVSTLFNPGA
tara:strand:+ start:396 stop:671 length:276 start_codon:yes stop_codon:yes gene_type:complete